MSLHTELVKIEEEKISSDKAKKFIASEKNGAESIFVGKVRNENYGKKVIAVTYDAHDQAVIKSFQSICSNAKNKFIYILLFLFQICIKLVKPEIWGVLSEADSRNFCIFCSCRMLNLSHRYYYNMIFSKIAAYLLERKMKKTKFFRFHYFYVF